MQLLFQDKVNETGGTPKETHCISSLSLSGRSQLARSWLKLKLANRFCAEVTRPNFTIWAWIKHGAAEVYLELELELEPAGRNVFVL